MELKVELRALAKQRVANAKAVLHEIALHWREQVGERGPYTIA